ncbi:hypothetical protein UXN57_00900 [Enterobacter hormaechei]
MKLNYEELEAKCAALAAENAGLKAFGDKLDEMHNDLNGEGTGIQGRAEVTCQQVALEAAMEEFDAIKTPATDAFLAEVRASGIDQWIASRNGRWNGTTAEAERFAAQLRIRSAVMITGTSNYDEVPVVPCKICGGYYKADEPELHTCEERDE